jgi:hypothetical protein
MIEQQSARILTIKRLLATGNPTIVVVQVSGQAFS